MFKKFTYPKINIILLFILLFLFISLIFSIHLLLKSFKSNSSSDSSVVNINDEKPESSYDICLINYDGSNFRKIAEGEYPQWFPGDDEVIFFIDDNYTNADFYRIDINGDNCMKLFEGEGPILSNDGKKVLIAPSYGATGHATSLLLYDLESLNKTILFEEDLDNIGFVSGWSISPDGNHIAFLCDLGGRGVYKSDWHLCLIDSNGKNFKEISVAWGYQWSPDSEKIVFAGADYQERNLFVYNLKTENIIFLDEGNDPDFSPDSEKIVYVNGRALYIINHDGSNKIEYDLTEVLDNWELIYSPIDPNWSPNGNKIAFCGNGMLNILNSGGSEFKQIAEVGGYLPTWSPDSNKILFTDYSIYTDTWYDALKFHGVTGYVYNTLNNNLIEVYDKGISFGSWSPSGEEILFFKYRK